MKRSIVSIASICILSRLNVLGFLPLFLPLFYLPSSRVLNLLKYSIFVREKVGNARVFFDFRPPLGVLKRLASHALDGTLLLAFFASFLCFRCFAALAFSILWRNRTGVRLLLDLPIFIPIVLAGTLKLRAKRSFENFWWGNKGSDVIPSHSTQNGGVLKTAYGTIGTGISLQSSKLL